MAGRVSSRGPPCASLAVTGVLCAHSPAGWVPRPHGHCAVSVTRGPSGRLGSALLAPGGCLSSLRVRPWGPSGRPWASAVPSGAVSPPGPLDASLVWVLAGLSYLSCGASSSGGLEMFFHCVLWKSVPRAPASGPSCEASLVSCAGGQPGSEIRPECGCRHARPRSAQAASGVRPFLQPGWAQENSTPASALKASCELGGDSFLESEGWDG